MSELYSKETYASHGITLPYRFHLPENMREGEKYPLVLFLHGAGERGSDNEMQLRWGMPEALCDSGSPLHDSYIIAPQCPLEKQWVDTPWREGAYSVKNTPETPYLAAAAELCEKVAREYSVDTDRVLVMGISMGGFGSWDALCRHGELFKGAFICCGSGDPAFGEALSKKPIYTYHGDLDEEVPVSGTRTVVEAIHAAGGERIFYKEYAGMNHWTWQKAYSEFEDMKALFASL